MNDYQLQIVSFYQAKKLKELGFNWKVINYYEYDCENPENFNKKVRYGQYGNFNKLLGAYSAPTIALALKWFRDVKKVICNVQFGMSTETYFGAFWFNDNPLITDDFDTYEAAESALLDELLN